MDNPMIALFCGAFPEEIGGAGWGVVLPQKVPK